MLAMGRNSLPGISSCSAWQSASGKNMSWLIGMTILPGSAREIAAEPTLTARPIDDASFARPIALIKKKGRTLPPASLAFLETCKQALGA